MAGAVVAALVALTVVLTVQAIHENAKLDRLHRDGIAVAATVSGCVAIASGTGITESGYRCRATFTLNGRSYTEVLGGTDALFSTGETVPAVVARNDPGNLSTTSAATRHATWTAFIGAGVALLVTGLFAGFLARRRRTRR
jgi:hypothetical protein